MSEVVARFSLENNPLNVRYSLSDGSEVDAIFKIDAAGTTWGSIDGTLSNQTDLQDALNLKADKTELDADIQEVNTSINTLSQTVTANYNALDGKIDNEISSRTLADTTLQNNIDAEALARQNADTTLQGNIDTLSQTVTDNNTAINNRVDGVVSAFDDEIENINNNISDLSDTVSDNYTDLDDKISDNTSDITDINNTINAYGDIVTYNAADFATSTQGALADSALQSGDNISELVNNVGYITSASLPTDYVPNTRTINGYALTSNITLNYSDVGALSSSTTINDLTTTAQQNALNSGATATNIGQITTNANDISDIQDLIPNQASSSNQLADKDFVNSSIATNTANFIGTFNSVAELEAYSGTLTNNDYAFVATTDSAGNTLYDRYKYNADTQEWLFEYELNNSSFTAQQWASINSGATTTNIGQIATNASDISDLQTNKQDVLTAGTNIQINNNVISATDTTYTAGTGISIVNGVISNTQTSAEWGNITGVLSSQTDLQDALDDKYDASNPSGFITGITSSDVTTALGYTPYNSTNPNGYITISALNGYATETWVTNQGYITGITSSDVTTALGYTPYNATNPNGYITASALTGYATETYVDTGLATKQATLVSGTNIKTINNISLLGSGDITITSAPDIDNKSITTNSDDELQTVGVIDQNNTTNAIKTWTGTKAQYDAIVTKDANTLYWLTDVKIIYLGDTPVGNFSGNRNIGEIVTSTIPLTDAGLHLLDGALINGSGIYADFVTAIAGLVSDYPDLFETEANWQSAVTTYGVCGKFVYDSVNNTVRLPKITGIVEGTTDVTALGDLVEAGLPVHTHTRGTMNITGNANLNGLDAGYSLSGCFYGVDKWNDYTGHGAYGKAVPNIYFDASRNWTGSTSNPNYTNSAIQNSNTVQPQTIKVLYYIVIATSTKTEIEVDIDEIATDLNGKADADLTNINNTGYIKMAKASMPSNRYTDLTLGASGSSYTAPADGWFYISKTVGSDFFYLEIVVYDTNWNRLYGVWDDAYRASPVSFIVPIKKGNYCQVVYNATGATNWFRFVYAVGSESEA